MPRKTKIICTLGPAVDAQEMMEGLIKAGMNVARINFTHATIEEREQACATVREVRKRTGKSVAILWDTKGPEFRSGMLENDSIELVPGNIIRIVKENVLEEFYRKHRRHYRWKLPHFKGIVLQSSDKIKLDNLEKCLHGYPQEMWLQIIERLKKTSDLSWLKMDYGLFQIGTNACVDKLYFGV